MIRKGLINMKVAKFLCRHKWTNWNQLHCVEIEHLFVHACYRCGKHEVKQMILDGIFSSIWRGSRWL